MQKNKNLVLFIGVGFIVTVLLWGFVGGCGINKMNYLNKSETDRSKEMKNTGAIQDVHPGNSVYIVKEGDTLWGISKKMNVSVADIEKTNNLKTSNIKTGQKLIMPYSTSISVVEEIEDTGDELPPDYSKLKETEDETPVVSGEAKVSDATEPVEIKKTVSGPSGYKVKDGDSLWRIAQSHGTTVEKILEINHLSKGAKLKPGQEIIIPNN